MAKLIEEDVLEEIKQSLLRLTDLLNEDLDRADDRGDDDWAASLTDELVGVKALQKLLRETPAV